MDNNAPAPPGNVGRPDWFLSWLKDVFLLAYKNPVDQKIEIYEDVVEKLPDIDKPIKKSLTTTLTNEARIDYARKDNKSKITELIKTQTLPAEEARCPGIKSRNPKPR